MPPSPPAFCTTPLKIRAATREEINKLFGDEIGALVDGVTKLDALDLVTKKAEQAENFRKLLIAISSDVACYWSSWPTACTICAPCSI